MQRIQTADERFAAGNPQLGTPGTIVTAKFLNDVQEEIANVIIESGLSLDGEVENQLSLAIKNFISDKSMLTFNSTPTAKINDIIYVLRKGILEWQTFGAWQGYASLDIGKQVLDTSPLPRSMTIDAIGGSYEKADYPALWAWALACGHVVPSASWAPKWLQFIDQGAKFRVPDFRDIVERATGVDLDNANARLLGSYQEDAIKDHAHGLFLYTGPSTETKGNSRTAVYAPAAMRGDGGIIVTYGANQDVNASSLAIETDSYSSAPKAETRGENVAFAPRIIAY